jgi:hypothetical protein
MCRTHGLTVGFFLRKGHSHSIVSGTRNQLKSSGWRCTSSITISPRNDSGTAMGSDNRERQSSECWISCPPPGGLGRARRLDTGVTQVVECTEYVGVGGSGEGKRSSPGRRSAHFWMSIPKTCFKRRAQPILDDRDAALRAALCARSPRRRDPRAPPMMRRKYAVKARQVHT